MKKSLIQKWSASLALSVALALGANAQMAVDSASTTTTTTSSGTVSEFSPDTVVLRSTTSSTPMSYSYSKTTTVVDEAGAPVDVSIIKTGVPVQVFYAKEGDRMIARKIIVQKKTMTAPAAVEEHKSTTTTTTTD